MDILYIIVVKLGRGWGKKTHACKIINYKYNYVLVGTKFM